VCGPEQTGVERGQSALEPEPALPSHDGVVHRPTASSQTWPPLHCPSLVHCTISVPVLVAPALVAVTASLPMGRSDVGAHDQVPLAATVAVHTATPLAVTATVCPATPVPEIAWRWFVVVLLSPAGGVVSATAGATHRNVAEL
jgi:hypothetical protein